jgi:hypothetical protein
MDTMESLHEELVPCVLEACGGGPGGFLTFAEYGVVPATIRVLRGTGRFASLVDKTLHEEVVRQRLSECLHTEDGVFGEGFAAFPFSYLKNFILLVYVEISTPIEKEHRQLLSFFTDQVTSSLSALAHAKHAERTSRATVVALASLAEHKDQDTGGQAIGARWARRTPGPGCRWRASS